MTVSLSAQVELDLIQAAQYRVAADTRLLKKRATLPWAAGSTTLALPDEVIRLEALYTPDNTQIVPVTHADYLNIVTNDTAILETTDTVFCVIGRTLYLWPVNGAAEVLLTAFYSYRPAAIDSSSSMELDGQAERLVERIVATYALMDDGQPELAQTELGEYYKDMNRLKHQDRRREGKSGQFQVLGHRRRR